MTHLPNRRVNDIDLRHTQLLIGEIGYKIDRSPASIEQHGAQFERGVHFVYCRPAGIRGDIAMMLPMRIRIVCPAPPGTLYGNRITAERWARILRQLGHGAAIGATYNGEGCDLLLALHARKSAQAVFDFARRHPDRPVIVALTGTDVYRDIHRSRAAQRAMEIATRLVVLQELAIGEVDGRLRYKARVIHQSVERTPKPANRPKDGFQIVVAGHLRNVKDPFRAAMAVRSLPACSRIRVLHAGAALTGQMARRVESEQQRNPRYCWLGEIPRWRVRRLIASSHVMVLSSRMEGGANVISEAVVDGTPVVASRIPGSMGLLGADYPGFYPFGETDALRCLLLRAESDSAFYEELLWHAERVSPLFRPEHERSAWRDLLGEL
jgi:putative glycosyltransferase (TIGR04348 family)